MPFTYLLLSFAGMEKQSSCRARAIHQWRPGAYCTPNLCYFFCSSPRGWILTVALVPSHFSTVGWFCSFIFLMGWMVRFCSYPPPEITISAVEIQILRSGPFSQLCSFPSDSSLSLFTTFPQLPSLPPTSVFSLLTKTAPNRFYSTLSALASSTAHT